MSSKDSTRHALRTATAPHHARVDAIYSLARLDDPESYGRFLQAQAAAHIATEQALERGGITGIVADWPQRRRADAVRADLEALGLKVPPVSDDLQLDSEEAMLGALYVLEGSRLGGTLLKRSVSADLPTQFLGNVDSSAWQALLAELDSRLDSTGKREAAIAAAQLVFDLFEDSGRRYLTAD